MAPQRNRTGAILLAVMGSRLSEGVNFSDRLARAVVVVGQPYPNIHDVETRERAEHYARLWQGDSRATSEYLENTCMRTVNQTIGRAIRHAQDYAAIILIDARYGHARTRAKLSTWIQPALFPPKLGTADFGPAFAQLVSVRIRKEMMPLIGSFSADINSNKGEIVNLLDG